MALENVVVRTEEVYMSEWGTLSVMIKEEPVWEAAVKLEDESVPDVNGDEASFSDPLNVGEHDSQEGTAPSTLPESYPALDLDRIIIKSEDDFVDAENFTSSTEIENSNSEKDVTKNGNKGSTYSYINSETIAVNKKRYQLLPVPNRSTIVSSTGQLSVCMQSDEGLFLCDCCSARFKSKKNLKRHRVIHEKSFKRNSTVAKRRPFTAAEKLKFIRLADELRSNYKAGHRAGVSESTIRAWKKQRAVLEKASHSCKSFRRGIPHFKELERQLYEYLLNCQAKRQTVSLEMIRSKALRLFRVIYPHEQDFKASPGWIDRFFKRHSLSLPQINCFKSKLDFVGEGSAFSTERSESGNEIERRSKGITYNNTTVKTTVTSGEGYQSFSVLDRGNDVSSTSRPSSVCTQSDEKLFSCDLCSAQFKLKKLLQKHLATHEKSFRQNSTAATRRSYTAAEKLKIISLADKLGSNCKAAKREGISESSIRLWRKQRGKLETASHLCMSFRGGVPHFKELEKQLYEYVLNCRAKRQAISVEMIRSKALRLFKVIYLHEQQDFKASKGWIRQFLKRHSLRLGQINCFKSELDIEEGGSSASTKQRQSEPEKAGREKKNGGTIYIMTGETTVASKEQLFSVSKTNNVSSPSCRSSVGLQSDETLFSCDHCPARFKSKRLMERHLAIHKKSFRQTSTAAMRGSYTAAEKLKIIRLADELGSNCKAAHREGICESSIRAWRKQRAKLETAPHLCRAFRGGVAHFKELEKQLYEYVMNCRAKKQAISLEMIRSEALRLFRVIYPREPQDFNASTGWVYRFFKRHSLSTHQINSSESELVFVNERSSASSTKRWTRKSKKAEMEAQNEGISYKVTVETTGASEEGHQSSVSETTNVSSTSHRSSVGVQSDETLFSCDHCLAGFKSKRLMDRHLAIHQKSFKQNSTNTKCQSFTTTEKLKTIRLADELGSNRKVANREVSGGSCSVARTKQLANVKKVYSSCRSFCERLARFQEVERLLWEYLLKCHVKEQIFAIEMTRIEALQSLCR